MRRLPDLNTPQVCRLCGGGFTVRALVENLVPDSYWPELDVVEARPPCCQHREELRIGDGIVWRGYTYAAATAHFADMEKYEAPTLELIKKGKGSPLLFKLDNIERRIEKRPTDQ